MWECGRHKKSEPAPGRGPALKDLILGTGVGRDQVQVSKNVSPSALVGSALDIAAKRNQRVRLPTKFVRASSIAIHCPLFVSDCRLTYW